MESLADAEPHVRPMVPGFPHPSEWKRELREAIRDPDGLCDYLGLPRQCADSFAASEFPLLVPRGFADRMGRGDPNDPLLLQVLPRHEEAEPCDLPLDAVGDLCANPAPGLLRKYHGRALLLLAGHCAVNCRYCFRRHFPYGQIPRGDGNWEPAINELRRDTTIQEVILSGGDPLMLTDDRIECWFARLDSLPHLKRLRIHSRLPIVIPSRVTERLCDLLASSRLQQVLVLHVNHANELNEEVVSAVKRLQHAGALTLNQSVLLRGVNDCLDRLRTLCEQLVNVGVIPYYVHQLDLVDRVQHFAVPSEVGASLVEQLRVQLPGYAIPQFVQEVAGCPSKVPIPYVA